MASTAGCPSLALCQTSREQVQQRDLVSAGRDTTDCVDALVPILRESEEDVLKILVELSIDLFQKRLALRFED